MEIIAICALVAGVAGVIGYVLGRSANASALGAAVAARDAAQSEAAQWKGRTDVQQAQVVALTSAIEAARARMEEQQKNFREQMGTLESAEARLKDTFSALATSALQGTTEQFLELAKAKLTEHQRQAEGDLELRKKEVEQLVSPLSDELKRFQTQLHALETQREGAYQGIVSQVNLLIGSQESLRFETSRLVGALRTPVQRGRWGEVQLKRVVELAGMVEHCDFEEQLTLKDDNDRRLRPDLVVQLPGGRSIVVDSKVSLAAYLDAMQGDDEVVRGQKMQEHATQVREHLKRLSGKAYWEQFDSTPEFVVAFLPGESFLSAALQQDPTLIEFGAEQRVILATPTTLIALLKAVAYGWRQEQLAANAQRISELGAALYDRLRTSYDQMSKLKRSLESSVDNFNGLVGTMESRVMVSARRFRELGAASGDDIAIIEPIEKKLRDTPFQPALIKSLAAAAGDDPDR